jgi:hypothetical protein
MGLFTNHKVAAENKVRREAARLPRLSRPVGGCGCPIRGAFSGVRGENSHPPVDTCGGSNTCVPTDQPFSLPKKLQSKFRQRLMYHGPNASGCDGIMTCI